MQINKTEIVHVLLFLCITTVQDCYFVPSVTKSSAALSDNHEASSLSLCVVFPFQHVLFTWQGFVE